MRCLSVYREAERGRGGMGDGAILPSELEAVLDGRGIRDPDEREILRRVVYAMDAESMLVRKERLDQERAERDARTRRGR